MGDHKYKYGIKIRQIFNECSKIIEVITCQAHCLDGRLSSAIFSAGVPGARVVKALNHLQLSFSPATLQPKAASACCSIPATTQAPRPGCGPDRKASLALILGPLFLGGLVQFPAGRCSR